MDKVQLGSSNPADLMNTLNPFEQHDLAASSLDGTGGIQNNSLQPPASLPALPQLQAKSIEESEQPLLSDRPEIVTLQSTSDAVSVQSSDSSDLLTGSSSDQPLVQSIGNKNTAIQDALTNNSTNDLTSLDTAQAHTINKSALMYFSHRHHASMSNLGSFEMLVKEAINRATTQLQQFASDPEVIAKMQLLFGDSWRPERGQRLVERLASGDYKDSPLFKLEILPTSELEAQGAFAAQTNTIYLSERFLANNPDNPDAIATVLLEEAGHYLDAQLNRQDSLGDEGALFSAIVEGWSLPEEQWQAWKTANDFGVLNQNGREVSIEQASFSGTVGNDWIIGSVENDNILGQGGNDTLFGQGGNDYLSGDSGQDQLWGEAGDDNLFGYNEDDVLRGGEGSDDLYGESGNDSLYGDAGSDYLYGGYNNDFLEGGDDHDWLEGESGDDSLYGQNGWDRLYGGTGNDRIWGGTWNDTALGGTGNDWLDGGDDNDELWGETGNDSLFGQAGNDSLWGGSDDDWLDGGSGNDTLSGGNGNDWLDGGTGNDSLIGGGLDGEIDTIKGGEGDDILRIVGQAELWGGLGSDQFRLFNDLYGSLPSTIQDFVSSAEQSDSIQIGLGSSAIQLQASQFLSGANVTAAATTSHRVLYNTTTGALFFDADGSDSLFQPMHIATLANKAVLSPTNIYLAPTIVGTAGNDSLVGIDGSNWIEGQAGNDTLDGGAYTLKNTLSGGTGNDTYYVNSPDDAIVEELNGGLDIVYASVDFSIALMNQVENLTLTGSAVRATGNTLGNSLMGNTLNNTLDGGDGNDTLNGSTGADIMIGGAGNDTYLVDSASDVVVEEVNGGTDIISSSIDYSLASLSNVENLTLSGTATQGTGNALNNTLTGNALNNRLDGGDGNDTLNGSTGADTMIGGIGNDLYYVDSASDVVVEAASSGTDIISSSIDYSLTSLSDVENLTLTGTATQATGNALNNTLTGNALNNRLDGGDGNDTLNGSTGADTMIGGAGNDTYLVDSASDVVVEAASSGTDTISSSIDYSLASLGGVENLTLTGTATQGTGNALNNALTGNALNNRLDGGIGNDTLKGGAGADTLVAGVGTDELWGETGTDTFELSKSNRVTIRDYSPTENDVIQLGQGSMVSQLQTSQFLSGAGITAATTSNHRVLYNTSTGDLYYDADGVGTLFSPVLVATLTNRATLSAANLYIAANPTITVGLTQDTAPAGTTNTDRITANPALNGTISSTTQISKFRAGFDNAPVTSFVDVQSNLFNNSFQFNRSQLETINGGTLSEGTHLFRLIAEDAFGNASGVEFSFTLDTIAPTFSGFDLASQFNLTPSGTPETVHPTVTLTGQTQANAVITLQQTGVTVTADATGHFEFAGVNLALGMNSLTASVVDVAGNVSTRDLTVKRIEPFITGGLKLDTGRLNNDGKTADATVTGRFTLPGQFAELLGSFDGSTFVRLSPTLNSDGSFTLDRSQLALLKAGTLPDGAYTLSLKAKDTLGNVSQVKTVAFTLDTTAAAFEVTGLIDGIRWRQGELLSGKLKQLEEVQAGTLMSYKFDGQAERNLMLNSTTGQFTASLDDIPTAEGTHTLTIASADEAGNQQTMQYTFLVRERKIIDDDQYIGTNPVIIPNPPPSQIQNDPIVGSIFGTAGAWLANGGISSYGSWGDGQPGNSAAVANQSNYNYVNDLTAGSPSYLAKLAIILDSTITKGITPSNKQGALVNRFNVLMAIGDMVDQEGFYDRMEPVLHGIFDEADDLIHTKAEARTRGYGSSTVEGLYKQLTDDPDAVKLEVMQAALFAVVYQVFADNGYTPGSNTNEQALAKSLLELATTYASFNPRSDTSSSTSIDFLDSLWRAQKSLEPQTIRTELQRSILALDKLLEGVANPIQAFKFVNNLLKAAGDTASLDGAAIHDAQFLRELVAFGFEYAKLNPNLSATATENGTETFLATFWQNTVNDSTAMRQATGKLDDLFAGLETKEKRLKLLQFETNLLKAIGLSNELQQQDAKLLSAMMELGGAYVQLKSTQTTDGGNDLSSSFLKTLWNIQNTSDLQQVTEHLGDFLYPLGLGAAIDAENTDRLVAAINSYSIDERQLILSNQELMNRVRDLGSVSAVVTTASLLVGSQNWAIVGGLTTDFGQHYVSRRQTEALSYNATLNCGEMVLYAAYLVGEISRQQIEEFYSAMGSGGISAEEFFSSLGWNEELPDYQDTSLQREGKPIKVPKAGDLIFFTKIGDSSPQHVAISLGGELIISLNEDNPIPFVDNFDIDPVRRIKITELPNIENHIVQVGPPITQVF